MSVAEGIAAAIVSVALACAASGCSGTSTQSPSQAAETGAGTGHTRGRATLGDVIVRGDPREGTVIRDRATHGKRFFLTGIQASECLSYLKANPAPAARDVRAACPGKFSKASNSP